MERAARGVAAKARANEHARRWERRAARRWRTQRALLGLSAALALLESVSGCETTPAMPLTGSEAPSQAFEISLDFRDSLLRKVLPASSTLRICLTGAAVTSETRDGYVSRIRTAIERWLYVVSQVSASPSIGAENVVFVACDETTAAGAFDVAVHWSDEQRSAGWCALGTQGCHRAHVDGFNAMYLYQGDSTAVVTHEFGHIFGLLDTYLEGDGSCREGQPPSLMCSSASGAIADDDREGIFDMFCSLFPDECKLHWSGSLDWCGGSGQQLLLGDFDGDHQTDVLCHDNVRGLQRISYAKQRGFGTRSWSNQRESWCGGASSTLLIGDVDRDQHADLICHDRSTGSVRVARADRDGSFALATAAMQTGFCRGELGSVHSADFDGDQRADLLCLDASPGAPYMAVMLARSDAIFERETWRREGAWCGGPGLLVGDFDGDTRADLLCHESSAPVDRFLFAASDGTFPDAERSASGWCRGTYDMQLGAFNQDSRTDISCHGSPSNPLADWYIRFASEAATFSGDSQSRKLEFCREPGAELHTGDFDADWLSDFLCYDRARGSVSILYRHSPS